MPYSKLENERLVQEVFDNNRVVVFCSKHMYGGGDKPPTRGCSDCWRVYYIIALASVPPHLRDEELAKLEALVHHMCEEADAGKFDFVPFARPEISIERGTE